MHRVLQAVIVTLPIAVLAGCGGMSDQDRALLNQTNQNAAAAKTSADRAAELAQQAATAANNSAQTAQQAEQQAQAASDKADRAYQRGLRK